MAVRRVKVNKQTETKKTPVTEERKYHYVSTGSTQLDLAISGRRNYGGGIPSGIMMLLVGEYSLGKTGILVEVGANAQYYGGDVFFSDAEARLDRPRAKSFGLTIPDQNYDTPKTVQEWRDSYLNWAKQTAEEGIVNFFATDSLTALTTDLELKTGDKMSMRRAKEFSSSLRVMCKDIVQNDHILLCTNQVRAGDFGKFIPGGKAQMFYSSVVVEVYPMRVLFNRPNEITTTVVLEGEKNKSGKSTNVEIEKDIGIWTAFRIIKNSHDIPFRKGYIRYLFDYGIDDIGANLQWLKDTTGSTMYKCEDASFQSLNGAVKFAEENDLAEDIREKTISLWNTIEEKLREQTARKQRRRIDVRG